MLKRITLLSIGVLSIVGCQQPVVHVYHQGLDDTQRFQLTQQLAAQEIKYELNDLRTPDKYTTPHLLYFPDDVNQAFINKIESIVKGLGYDNFDSQIFSQTGHYYNRGNLGLYFPVKHSQNELPDLVFSHQCEDEFQINLKANGHWRVSPEPTDSSVHKYTWTFAANYLTLMRHFDDGTAQQQVYEAKQGSVQTLQGIKPATTFAVAGHRSYSFKVFNCDLQAIFAN